MMYGLRTWWVDAVGTTALTLHVSPASLARRCASAASSPRSVCIWWTLRCAQSRLRAQPARWAISARTPASGRSGAAEADVVLPLRPSRWSCSRRRAARGGGAQCASIRPARSSARASLLLVASLCLFAAGVPPRPPRTRIDGRGWLPVSRLGFRNGDLPAGPQRARRSAVIASATFILISVDAFRRERRRRRPDPRSGLGGYYAHRRYRCCRSPTIPNTREGRERIEPRPTSTETVAIEPFRVRPGDDASCLNLYEPTNPRILAPRDAFLDAGRFAFQRLAGDDRRRARESMAAARADASRTARCR